MKKIFLFLMLAPMVCLFFSCSRDVEEIKSVPTNPIPTNQFPGDDRDPYRFTLLITRYGDFYDYPVEYSPTESIVGKWILKKIGTKAITSNDTIFSGDEDSDDFECGQSYVQFNSDGFCFENYHKKDKGKCLTISSYIYNWKKVDEKIYIYENDPNFSLNGSLIPYEVLKESKSKLMIMRDWDDADWGGTFQYFYYLEKFEE